MAEVFLAKAEGPGGFEKRLVLKRIRPQFAERKSFVQMFLNEARIAAQFDHQNIVQIFDFGEAEGAHYLAMEFVDGLDLRSLLRWSKRSGEPLSFALLARVISLACDGLAYAHEFIDPQTGQELQLIHRDVSPENIMISRGGAVKVLDFGVARVAGTESSTRVGTLKGKVAYMPREQVLGLNLDLRIDVYALGAVMYQLLTGHKPYGQTDEVRLIAAILNGPPPPLRERNPQVPPELAAIVERAMAYDRDQRYGSCRELHAALERYLLSTAQSMGAAQLAQLVVRAQDSGLVSSKLSWGGSKDSSRGSLEPVSGPVSTDGSSSRDAVASPARRIPVPLGEDEPEPTESGAPPLEAAPTAPLRLPRVDPMAATRQSAALTLGVAPKVFNPPPPEPTQEVPKVSGASAVEPAPTVAPSLEATPAMEASPVETAEDSFDIAVDEESAEPSRSAAAQEAEGAKGSAVESPAPAGDAAPGGPAPAIAAAGEGRVERAAPARGEAAEEKAAEGAAPSSATAPDTRPLEGVVAPLDETSGSGSAGASVTAASSRALLERFVETPLAAMEAEAADPTLDASAAAPGSPPGPLGVGTAPADVVRSINRVTDLLPIEEARRLSLAAEALDPALPEEPVVAAPAVEQRVAEQPVVAEPVAGQPLVEQPVTAQPVVEQSVAAPPVAARPVVEQPVAAPPVAAQAVTAQAVTAPPVAAQPVAAPAVAAWPVVEQPVNAKPVAAQPVVEQSVVDQSVAAPPVVEQSVAAPSVAEEPGAAQPVAAATALAGPVAAQPIDLDGPREIGDDEIEEVAQEEFDIVPGVEEPDAGTPPPLPPSTDDPFVPPPPPPEVAPLAAQAAKARPQTRELPVAASPEAKARPQTRELPVAASPLQAPLRPQTPELPAPGAATRQSSRELPMIGVPAREALLPQARRPTGEVPAPPGSARRSSSELPSLVPGPPAPRRPTAELPSLVPGPPAPRRPTAELPTVRRPSGELPMVRRPSGELPVVRRPSGELAMVAPPTLAPTGAAGLFDPFATGAAAAAPTGSAALVEPSQPGAAAAAQAPGGARAPSGAMVHQAQWVASPQAQEALKQAALADRARHVGRKFLLLASRLFEAGTEPPGLREALAGSIDAALLSEDHALLTQSLERGAAQERFSAALQQELCAPLRMVWLVERLRAPSTVELAPLEALLGRLGPALTPQLVWAVESTDPGEAQELFCRQLGPRLTLDASAVLERLEQAPVAKLAAWCHALELSQSVERQKAFHKLLGRRDAAVTVQVMTGRARARTAEAYNTLEAGLGDKLDEVRRAAVRLLGELGDARAVALLAAQVTPAFESKPLAERAAVWAALASAQAPSARAILEQAAGQKLPLLNKRKGIDARLGLIEGLGQARSELAGALLQRFVEDKGQPDEVLVAARAAAARRLSAAAPEAPARFNAERRRMLLRSAVLDTFYLVRAAGVSDVGQSAFEPALQRLRESIRQLLAQDTRFELVASSDGISVNGALVPMGHPEEMGVTMARALNARDVRGIKLEVPVPVTELRAAFLRQFDPARELPTVRHVQFTTFSGKAPPAPVAAVGNNPAAQVRALLGAVVSGLNRQRELVLSAQLPAFGDLAPQLEELAVLYAAGGPLCLSLLPGGSGGNDFALGAVNTALVSACFAADLGLGAGNLRELLELGLFSTLGTVGLAAERRAPPGDPESDEARGRVALWHLAQQRSRRGPAFAVASVEAGLPTQGDPARVHGVQASILALAHAWDALAVRGGEGHAMALELMNGRFRKRFHPELLGLFTVWATAQLAAQSG